MAQTTFFETIPLDALPILLQYLSDRPHARDWLKSVPPKDALAVCMPDSNEALSAVARLEFRNLIPHGHTRFEMDGFNILANSIAPHVEKLYVPPSFMGTLNNDQFIALRVLIFEECKDATAMEQILAGCGHNLRELYFKDVPLKRSTIRKTAEHCGSLEVLEVSHPRSGASLAPIWNSVGAQLRVLQGQILNREFVQIARHCAQLETLKVFNIAYDWADSPIVELVTSLPALRLLQVSFLMYVYDQPQVGAEQLRVALAKCSPDLRINSTLRFTENDDCIDYVRTMGRRLRMLSLQFYDCSFPADLAPLFVDLEEWLLYKMSSGCGDFGLMESIFPVQMPNLRKLTISNIHSTNMFEYLAHRISSLREFRFHFSERFENGVEVLPFKGSDFDALLQANKQLEKFGISYRNMGVVQKNFAEIMIREIADLIQRLRKYTSLMEVNIDLVGVDLSNWDILRNACVPLRNRRVNLVVNDERLLPAW